MTVMSYFSVQKKICTLNWDFTTPGMKSYFSVQNLFSELGLGLGLGLGCGLGLGFRLGLGLGCGLGLG